MSYIENDICFFDSMVDYKDKAVIAFSTRNGGYSSVPFNSMNLGLNTADSHESVDKNRELILDKLGLSGRAIISTSQVHGDRIQVVDEKFINSEKIGLGEHFIIENTDGIILKTDKAACMTYYADCTPIFVYDSLQAIVGVAHSGWKGCSLRIGERLVELMCLEHGSDRKNLKVAIGPTAEDCCYEVDERVVELFREAGFILEDFLTPKGGGYYSLSMPRANLQVMLKAGIPKENIEIYKGCTLCEGKRFFSHRRDGVKAGRMSGIIGIR